RALGSRLRITRERRIAHSRRPARRHVHHHQWRCVRLADEHAHPQSAAGRHPWAPRDQGSAGRRRWAHRAAPDDVHRPDLRPPDRRRRRSRALPRARQGTDRGSGPAPGRRVDGDRQVRFVSRPLAISLALVAAVVLGAAWMLGVFDGPRETPAGTSDVPATSAPAEPAPAAPSAPATSRAPRPEPRASVDVPEIRTPLPPPTTTGSLTIESDVVGADVFIDNAFVGKVPASVDAVTPGRRKISVSAPGYETVTEFVDVSPGPAV